MAAMRPFFSVLVPVYNGSSTLPRCLDSIIQQTYPNFELLVCDDKSSDGTLDILRRYASADPRMRILEHRTNLGRSEAHNDLNHDATAPFSICVDADDEISRDFLETAFRILSNDDSYDILNFPCELRFGNGSRRFNPGQDQTFVGENMLQTFLSNDAYQGAWWSKVFRTELLRNLQPLCLDNLQMDDGFFMVPLYHSARKYRFVANAHPMYIYYGDQGQWSSMIRKMTPELFQQRCKLYYTLYILNLRFMQSHQLPPQYSAAFLKIYNLNDFFMILQSYPAWRQEGIRIFRQWFLGGGNLLSDGSVQACDFARFYEEKLRRLERQPRSTYSFVGLAGNINISI